MGHIRIKLQDLANKLNELKANDEGLDPEELDKHNAAIYKETYQVIDEHINQELDEENQIGSLIESFQNYRKHLKFARIVLDKDFASEQGDTDNDIELSCQSPDVNQDKLNAQRQVKLAMDEWNKARSIMKRLLEEGKVKFE
ncbi:MAG: hypothetical protein ACLFP2_02380 [Candidatus Woesearchaeota archaeon]